MRAETDKLSFRKHVREFSAHEVARFEKRRQITDIRPAVVRFGPPLEAIKLTPSSTVPATPERQILLRKDAKCLSQKQTS